MTRHQKRCRRWAVGAIVAGFVTFITAPTIIRLVEHLYVAQGGEAALGVLEISMLAYKDPFWEKREKAS